MPNLKDWLQQVQDEEPVDADKVRDDIVAALKQVYDPEIPVNIYDLGLIYGIDVEPFGDVHVTMTLTSPNCPVAESLPAEVEQKVAGVEHVRKASLEITWEPPWTPQMMSDAAKLELGMDDLD